MQCGNPVSQNTDDDDKVEKQGGTTCNLGNPTTKDYCSRKNQSYQQSKGPSGRGSKVISNSGFSVQMMGLLYHTVIDGNIQQQPLLCPLLRTSHGLLMKL